MTAEFIVAVHALVFLNHQKASLSSEVIAQNVCTNPARVRKVLARLKEAGLVCAKGGAEGGYAFCADPEQVTLRDVLDAIGEAAVSVKWRSGSTDMKCLIASGMAAIMDDILLDANESCKQRLQLTTIGDINRQLFG